jgi:hypothetical protein
MKGYVGKFIVMLVMLGIFSIVFITTNKAYEGVYSWGASNIDDADSVVTLTLLNTAWVWFPVVVLFTYVIYTIDKSQQEVTY